MLNLPIIFGGRGFCLRIVFARVRQKSFPGASKAHTPTQMPPVVAKIMEEEEWVHETEVWHTDRKDAMRRPSFVGACENVHFLFSSRDQSPFHIMHGHPEGQEGHQTFRITHRITSKRNCRLTEGCSIRSGTRVTRI